MNEERLEAEGPWGGNHSLGLRGSWNPGGADTRPHKQKSVGITRLSSHNYSRGRKEEEKIPGLETVSGCSAGSRNSNRQLGIERSGECTHGDILKLEKRLGGKGRGG